LTCPNPTFNPPRLWKERKKEIEEGKGKRRKEKKKEREKEETKKFLRPSHARINQSKGNLCDTSTVYYLQERSSYPNYYYDIAEFNRVAGGRVWGRMHRWVDRYAGENRRINARWEDIARYDMVGRCRR